MMANPVITYKVDGLVELQRRLDTLKNKTSQKIIRSAVTAGAPLS